MRSVELVRQYGMDEYEFAVHETKTHEVIEDVRNGKSEIGILYLNDFNRKVLEKIFAESAIEFHPLLECNVICVYEQYASACKEGEYKP